LFSFRRIVAGVAAAAASLVIAPSAAQASYSHGYVALGDSYSSGTGAPPYTDEACQRSDQAYPVLLSRALRLKPFDFAACAGAQTADVLQSQLDGLNRNTRLVTITIGGNDTGFGTGIATCLQGTDDDCAAAVESARVFTETELPGRLDAVYAAIRERAPRAKLVVAGYAHFFELTGECATIPMSLRKRTLLNGAVDTLDAAIAKRAAAAGARFADVRDAFDGHGLCGSDPWLTDLSVPGSFHPTATGHRYGYLPSILH
jgi:lysophospholipase L1-like esterase